MVEEENPLLTMTGAAGTESDNQTLIKVAMGGVEGNSSTHGKGFDEDDVEK